MNVLPLIAITLEISIDKATKIIETEHTLYHNCRRNASAIRRQWRIFDWRIEVEPAIKGMEAGSIRLKPLESPQNFIVSKRKSMSQTGKFATA